MGLREQNQRLSAENLVLRWNADVKVGTLCRYWRGVKRGEHDGVAPTESPADLIGGAAVVWLEGVRGCIALSHVEVI